MKQWEAGFYQGALSALSVIWNNEGNATPVYREIVESCGAAKLVAVARATDHLEDSGLTATGYAAKYPGRGDQ